MTSKHETPFEKELSEPRSLQNGVDNGHRTESEILVESPESEGIIEWDDMEVVLDAVLVDFTDPHLLPNSVLFPDTDSLEESDTFLQ